MKKIFLGIIAFILLISILTNLSMSIKINSIKAVNNGRFNSFLSNVPDFNYTNNVAIAAKTYLKNNTDYLNVTNTSDSDSGGMQYANWYFGQNNLKEVHITIDIKNDLSLDNGIYFQAYDGYINGRMFYFGIQTLVGRPGYGLTGKGLIFSEFGTTDSSNIKTALGGWYETGTYEGPFISTRLSYNWTTHKYTLTAKYSESDATGDWYEFWIEDLNTGIKTNAGALRFPNSPDASKKGITDNGGTWTELYYRKTNGIPLPEWSVSILEVSAISKVGNVIFPTKVHLKNADNFYHIDQAFYPQNNRLDFNIGGEKTKSFTEQDVSLSVGSINVITKLNGDNWNGALDFDLYREQTYSFSNVPKSLSNFWVGNYKIKYKSGGPLSAKLTSNILEQTLLSNSAIAFYFDFKTVSTYTITTKVSPSLSGSVTLDPLISTYTPGTTVTLTAVSFSGYHFVSWSGDIISTDNPIKITMNSNKTVTANFAMDTYIIKASAGMGGTIIPYGTVAVNYGVSKTFTITPNSGYKIKDVKVDGISFGTITSYTFTFITSNHSIEAIFEKQSTEIIIILHIGNSSFTVNNEIRYLDSPPIIKNNRTLLPIRAIVEALGGTVTWNESEKSVDIVLGTNHLILQIGNHNAYVNGVQKFIDPSNLKVRPEIVNGRTMLPLRFVAENLGCSVQWDDRTKTITITYIGY